MVHNKLFKVVEFAWKLRYFVCKRIKQVYNNLSKIKIYRNNRLICRRPNKINK